MRSSLRQSPRQAEPAFPFKATRLSFARESQRSRTTQARLWIVLTTISVLVVLFNAASTLVVVRVRAAGAGPNSLASVAPASKFTPGTTGTVAAPLLSPAGTITVGSNPDAIAVNPVTHKVYVANAASHNVTVISPDNTTVTVPVVWLPIGIGVNPVTNKIYVANCTHGCGVNLPAAITIINGADNTTETIPLPESISEVAAIAVNPVTNKIYIAGGFSRLVAILNGADNTMTTAPTSFSSRAIALNPVTNKIYVANCGSACGDAGGGNVTVINGADNTSTSIPAGDNPAAVAVNPVTNRIYVTNQNSGNVSVINGADNSTTTVNAGNHPGSLAVNPATNRIYVGNRFSNNVTVINGADNSTTTVPAGGSPAAVSVNPSTNKVYVANATSDGVTVINGPDNATVNYATGGQPCALGVNPVTNNIYVANRNDGTVTVINNPVSTTLVPAGPGPVAITVNPVTNKVYAANVGGEVTVINGANNSTATVGAGGVPLSIAVNSVTNKIYVPNFADANVTVINGADNTTAAPVPCGGGPRAVAVNEITNKVYVANDDSNSVTIINGDDDTATNKGIGFHPRAIAVNQVTNRIYTANSGGSNVTVINGADNTAVNVPAGGAPQDIAVNTVTNKIYTANAAGSVTIINGADNTSDTIPAGNSPAAIAVNPITNKIYVANNLGNNVTVINGFDNTMTTVPVGARPVAVAVNPVINKIYVSNSNSDNVTVINGADNTTTTIGTGWSPKGVAVNPLTDKAYVADSNMASVSVIATEQTQVPNPLTVSIAPQPFAPNSPSRTFTLTASSAFLPTAPPVAQIRYAVDTRVNPWLVATPAGSNTATASIGPLQDGYHLLFAYAVDGGDATSNSGSGDGSSTTPFIGQIQTYLFFVDSTRDPTTIDASFTPAAIPLGGTSALAFTLANPGATAVTAVSFSDTLPGGLSIADSSATVCGGGTLTTTAASRNISFSGGSLGAGANCTFNVQVTGSSPGLYINTTGNTSSSQGGTGSNASANIAVSNSPTAANGEVSGQIVDSAGDPVEGATVRLSGTRNRFTVTDAQGHYHFADVEANRFYTVTPSRANFSFSPAQRSFSQIGNHTEAAFTGLPNVDGLNPLDITEYFVRQHYLDFLGREPDQGGLDYWSDQINQCQDDSACRRTRRLDVSAAFFMAHEFQETGLFIHNLYAGALGRKPAFTEYSADRRQVVGGATLAAEKKAFVEGFVERPEFAARYQSQMTAAAFVDSLIGNIQERPGFDLSAQRNDLIRSYNAGADSHESRALVLGAIADNSAFKKSQYNAAFVLTEYFGYLRRDLDQVGYDFWLNVLNNREPNNFRGMVCSFINSVEYQRRFSSTVTRANAECGP